MDGPEKVLGGRKRGLSQTVTEWGGAVKRRVTMLFPSHRSSTQPVEESLPTLNCRVPSPKSTPVPSLGPHFDAYFAWKAAKTHGQGSSEPNTSSIDPLQELHDRFYRPSLPGIIDITEPPPPPIPHSFSQFIHTPTVSTPSTLSAPSLTSGPVYPAAERWSAETHRQHLDHTFKNMLGQSVIDPAAEIRSRLHLSHSRSTSASSLSSSAAGVPHSHSPYSVSPMYHRSSSVISISSQTGSNIVPPLTPSPSSSVAAFFNTSNTPGTSLLPSTSSSSSSPDVCSVPSPPLNSDSTDRSADAQSLQDDLSPEWVAREFQPPPTRDEAAKAYEDLKALISPRSKTGKRRGKFTGSNAVRDRLLHMQLFLQIYSRQPETGWQEASVLAAAQHDFGTHHARSLRIWTRAFLADRHALPVPANAKWNTSEIFENIGLRGAIMKHLQSLGPYCRAQDIVDFLDDAAIRAKHNLSKNICLSTAQAWMRKLDFRWRKTPRGQYVDGHEREDVVRYRQHTYIPAIKALRPGLVKWLLDGSGPDPSEPILPGVIRVIIWWHDESTFYMNDRRQIRWVPKGELPTPQPKGEGASLMVADFFSADFGWLRSTDGPSAQSARRLFKAGKNRDGYFTNEDIVSQAEDAASIARARWPDFTHVFMYDNATIHLKREDDALSARDMSKSPTQVDRFRNFGVDRTVLGPDGKTIKVRSPMSDATMNYGTPFAQPQSLYFPSDHPQAGVFKGMAVILKERGYADADKLRAECKKFDCAKPPASVDCEDTWYLNNPCCCRRLLYHQPDFRDVPPRLKTRLKALGVDCVFLPKFHCELNPIEQCWGHAKREYRKLPPLKSEESMEMYVMKMLDDIPITSMRKYYTRSMRFAHSYELSLNGLQAAWAVKQYKGHRAIPMTIFDRLTAEGLAEEPSTPT